MEVITILAGILLFCAFTTIIYLESNNQTLQTKVEYYENHPALVPESVIYVYYDNTLNLVFEHPELYLDNPERYSLLGTL